MWLCLISLSIRRLTFVRPAYYSFTPRQASCMDTARNVEMFAGGPWQSLTFNTFCHYFSSLAELEVGYGRLISWCLSWRRWVARRLSVAGIVRKATRKGSQSGNNSTTFGYRMLHLICFSFPIAVSSNVARNLGHKRFSPWLRFVVFSYAHFLSPLI